MLINTSSPITSWQIDGEKMETVMDFIFLASKIASDSDCSHAIKRYLLLGGKAITNLDSLLKSRDITFLTKIYIVKTMVFPVVMYGCESWTIKEAEHQRIDIFELWSWRILLRVPWRARRANQSTLKEINSEYSLKGLMLKLKLQNWSQSQLIRKDPDAGEDWGHEGNGATEDEMVGWRHRLNGYVFEQTPGDSKEQGSLACCSPWSHKELGSNKQLNSNRCQYNIYEYYIAWEKIYDMICGK